MTRTAEYRAGLEPFSDRAPVTVAAAQDLVESGRRQERFARLYALADAIQAETGCATWVAEQRAGERMGRWV